MQGSDRGCRNRNRFCSTVTSSTCPGPSAFADEEKYARIVPFAEIGRNDGSLNIGCSVDTSEERTHRCRGSGTEAPGAGTEARGGDEPVSGGAGSMTPDEPLSASRADAAQSPGLRDPRQEEQRY